MSILRRWSGSAWEDVTNNLTNTPTAGGIAYGDGSTVAFTAAGTAGYGLTSNGAGAPTWFKQTTYTGTPLIGTFDSTKPVQREFIHQSGTSDGTNGLISVSFAATYACVLDIKGTQIEPGTVAALIYLRPDLMSGAICRFQTKTFAGAAVISKAYELVVEVVYQA